MNIIPKIAEMLGVEIGEEFKIKECKGLRFESYYKFCSHRLVTSDNRKEWTNSNLILSILNGTVEIEKLPFEPKDGDGYWTVSWGAAQKPYTVNQVWSNDDDDYMCKYCGNCFRTQAEAEREKYNIYEKLTGKKWEE